MQPDRLEKLKNLINTSAILNSGEKAEWLVLLDVMNDKQAGDLEKILYSGSVDPKLAALEKAHTPGQMPQLSHIMNLPVSAAAKSAPLQIPQPDTKRAGQFAAKLKNIVEEKELPEGAHEAFLPGPAKPDVKPVSLPSSAAAAQPVKPVAHPRIQQPEKFSAGLIFPQASPTVQKETINAIKEHMVQPVPLGAAPGSKSHPLQKIKLEDLGDLTLLTPQILAGADLDQMAENIRHIMKKFSYHEALFNIEQSELYKTYLATGLKLLQEQIDFEEMAKRPRAEAYLEREEFEKFADLLRQIQNA